MTFRRNRRGLATVLGIVMFIGIAFLIMLTLVTSASNSNLAMIEAVQHRDKRLKEAIQITSFQGIDSTTFKYAIENTGSQTVHIVAVYVKSENASSGAPIGNVTWRATDYWLSVGETLIQEVEIGRQLFMDDVTGDLVTVATERGTQATLRCTPATAGGGGSVGPYVKPYSIGISIIDTPGHSVGTNDRFVYYVVARICSDPTPPADALMSPTRLGPDYSFGCHQGWYTVWAHQVVGKGNDWYGPQSLDVNINTPSPQVTFLFKG
jgi:hypothetical protein